MPKQVNESIGSCPCYIRGCEETAQVRRTAGKGVRRRLYLYCPTHRVVQLAGQEFQNYIQEHADMEADETQTPERTKEVSQGGQAAAAPRSGGGWNDWGLNDL